MAEASRGEPNEPDLIDADSLDFGLGVAYAGDGRRPGEGVAAAIDRMTGGAARVLLRDDHDAPSPIVRLLPSGSAERLGDDGRYQVMGEIARGGLGIVLKGRDRDLGRDVALKVLRPEFAKNDAVLARFVEEAQIGGQLQHPGIVPVYSLGIETDGRPFFAMKLVKGRTLASLLVDRKSPRDGQRRLLAVFEQVCRTMAYAHSRRVVHRDLKPSNVMLGAFGEIQVVDWGLAKVLGREDVPSVRPAETSAPEISLIATVRSGSAGSGSLAGSVLGTPGYMSPEQAIGRVEDVDERTDVFALGAILCEILTGQPPFVGEARDQIVLAARGSLDDAAARLAKCGADPAIVAVALKCLAAERGERFHDAGVLADAVTAHLSGIEARARRAEVAAAVARAKAEEERVAAARERVRAAAAKGAHRRTIALAAFALTSVAAGVVVWIGDRASESDRAGRSVAAVSAALADANAKRGAKELVGALAAAQKAVALARTGGADAETAGRAAKLVVELEAEDRAAAEAAGRAARIAPLLERLVTAHKLWDTDADRARSWKEHVAAFRDSGIDVEAQDVGPAATAIRSSPHAAEIAAELEFWAWELKWCKKPAPEDDTRIRHVHKLAGATDPDPWRTRFRDARDRNDLDAIRVLAAQADLSALPIRSLNLLSLAVSETDDKAALEQCRVAVRRYPGDWMSQICLGVQRRYSGWTERVGDEDCASDVAMLAMRPPTHRAWELVGEVCNTWRDPDGARAAFNEALRLQPGCHRSLGGLAIALDNGGNHAGAKEALSRAIEAVEARTKKVDAATYPAQSHFSMGKVLSAASDHAGAASAFRRAIELEPNDTEMRNWLAYELTLLRDFESAAAVAREMIRLAPKWTTGYSRLFSSLANSDAFDADALLAEVTRATAIFPKDALVLEWHADALYRRARQTWTERGREAAKPEYATAIDACRKYLLLQPKSGYLHSLLGTLLIDSGSPAEGAAEARIALRLGESASWVHYQLGRALHDGGEPEAALLEFESVIRLGAESVDVHCQICVCLSAIGDTVGELAHARRAVALAPESYNAHVCLANALATRSASREEDGWAEAAAETRRLLEIYSKDPKGFAADIGKSLGEGMASYERMLDPRFPEIVRGGLKPASRVDAEDIVSVCSYRDLNVPGVQCAVEALGKDPTIGDDESLSLRVNGACMSVLAADGQGDGAAALDSSTRDAWRRRALEWLHEVLPVYAARIVGDDPKKAMDSRSALRRWTTWPDLAPVRTPEGLAKLSFDDRVAWRRLWAEVDRALRSWSTRRKLS